MRGARPLGSLLLVAVLLLAGCTNTPTEAPDAGLEPAADPTSKGTNGVVHPSKGDGAPTTAPAAPAPTTSTDSPPAVPGAISAPAQGGLYHIGEASSEPTLGIDAAGNVYMSGILWNVLNGAPTIMRTSDKGQTFEDVGPRLPAGLRPAPVTFDPYVHVDRVTGRVFMDDIWPLGCGQMSFSDDKGATWITNPASCGNPQVNDHQTVGTAKPRVATTVGYPNVVYRCVNNLAYAACALSHNGGLTFSPQVPVVPFLKDCGAVTGHLASDPEGRMFLGTTTCNAGPTVAVTEDDGLTWTAHVIAQGGGANYQEHDLELASDEAGNLYAVWTWGGQIVLSHSVDHGVTWSPPRNVAAPGVTATMFATVAAAGPGKIAFAYVGSTIEGGYEGKPTGTDDLVGSLVGEPDTSAWANATWNGYIGVITDALSDDFVIETVSVNDPADPLARGVCGRTRCRGMFDFIDIEIDPEGRPWAAFVDVCTAACVTDPKVHSDKAVGAVGTLVTGPSLLAAGGLLAPIAPPPKTA